MELPSRQKCKKRKTSRQLDEIKKRSMRKLKDNKYKTKEKTLNVNETIQKNKYNEQITSKRLTLSLFNKTVQSKTVSRFPLTTIKRNDTKNGFSTCNGKETNWDFLPSNKRTNKTQSGSCFNSNNNNDLTYNTYITKRSKENNSIKNTPDSIILFSPMTEKPESVPQSPVTNNNKHVYLSVSSSSCSSSDLESADCLYQNFMNDLPNYLREHFPMLTKDIKMKNIPNSKQDLEHTETKRKKNNSQLISNSTLQNPNSEDLIIQNPMDYIVKGLSWNGSVNNKHCIFSSSSSSSSSHLEANGNMMYDHDSPEYIYFPHKLNQ